MLLSALCRHPPPIRVRCRVFGRLAAGNSLLCPVLCVSDQGQLRLRLTSGPSSCSGRVEVLINDTWGAVCDAGWGLPEAGVVCKQLGCGTALSAPGVAQFGHGAGDVWLEGVSCLGQESLITECQLSRLGPGLCGRGSEASVVCAGQAGE